MDRAEWRADPQRSGAAASMGDIGTHAKNLAEFISCLQIEEIAADLTAFFDGCEADEVALDYPKINDGIRGIAFIHAW